MSYTLFCALNFMTDKDLIISLQHEMIVELSSALEQSEKALAKSEQLAQARSWRIDSYIDHVAFLRRECKCDMIKRISSAEHL